MDAEQQRAERDPGAGRIGPAPDDELLSRETLRLEPVSRAARDPRPVPALRDGAFEQELAGGGVELRPAPGEVLHVAERPARGRRVQQCPQQLLAAKQQLAAQVETVEVEQVEGGEVDVVGSPAR